jgi:hypothetical protein
VLPTLTGLPTLQANWTTASTSIVMKRTERSFLFRDINLLHEFINYNSALSLLKGKDKNIQGFSKIVELHNSNSSHQSLSKARLVDRMTSPLMILVEMHITFLDLDMFPPNQKI